MGKEDQLFIVKLSHLPISNQSIEFVLVLLPVFSNTLNQNSLRLPLKQP